MKYTRIKIKNNKLYAITISLIVLANAIYITGLLTSRFVASLILLIFCIAFWAIYAFYIPKKMGNLPTGILIYKDRIVIERYSTRWRQNDTYYGYQSDVQIMEDGEDILLMDEDKAFLVKFKRKQIKDSDYEILKEALMKGQTI